MDKHFEQAWAPHFKEVAKELARKDPVYWTEDDKNLAKTQETSLWEPNDTILMYVDNLKDIQVVLFNEERKSRSEKEIFDTIFAEGSAGLILMGPIIDRENRPYLIVLTTKHMYYAFDPNDIAGIKLIWGLMGKPGFKFYMSNLLQEADCLRHQYIMDLERVEIKADISCATGLHIFMMQVLRHMGKACASKYPLLAWKESKYEPKILSFEKLVEIWLDVDSCHVKYEHNQLIHLKTRPLTIAALNLIKKRCSLVSQLNQVIDYYSFVEFWWASELTNNTLTMCNSKIADDLAKELSDKVVLDEGSKQGEITDDNNNETDDPVHGFSELVTHYANFGAAVSTERYITTQKIQYLPPSGY